MKTIKNIPLRVVPQTVLEVTPTMSGRWVYVFRRLNPHKIILVSPEYERRKDVVEAVEAWSPSTKIVIPPCPKP